jgi:hypothetical protein
MNRNFVVILFFVLFSCQKVEKTGKEAQATHSPVTTKVCNKDSVVEKMFFQDTIRRKVHTNRADTIVNLNGFRFDKRFQNKFESIKYVDLYECKINNKIIVMAFLCFEDSVIASYNLLIMKGLDERTTKTFAQKKNILLVNFYYKYFNKQMINHLAQKTQILLESIDCFSCK